MENILNNIAKSIYLQDKYIASSSLQRRTPIVDIYGNSTTLNPSVIKMNNYSEKYGYYEPNSNIAKRIDALSTYTNYVKAILISNNDSITAYKKYPTFINCNSLYNGVITYCELNKIEDTNTIYNKALEVYRILSGTYVVDEISATGCKFPIHISKDLCFWSRFEFKIVGNFTKAYIRDFDDGVFFDITYYLKNQYDIDTSENNYYPSNSYDSNYDLLKVASDMYADKNSRYDNQGKETDNSIYQSEEHKYTMLTKGGNKEIVFLTNEPITLILYLKYTHTNR